MARTYTGPIPKFPRRKYASRFDGHIPLCDNCGAHLDPNKKRFCSVECSRRFAARRVRRIEVLMNAGLTGKELEEGAIAADGPQHRKGRIVQELIDKDFQADGRGGVFGDMQVHGFFEQIRDGEITQTRVADILGYTQASISKAYKRWLEQQHAEKQAAGKQKALLPPELHEDNLDELVEHFAQFRTRYFHTPDKKPYLFPEHQRRWLRAILTALIGGSQVEILSPPRHGKTELLAHVCVWLIACINPNIRIMIVGGNQDIAANTVGMVKDQLDDNPELIRDYCPAGKTFRPGFKSGDPWTSEKFTLATRTVPGIKSPTMIAIGRGGKILSRDADLIVCDDIEDNESTNTETTREKTRRWWAITLMSRKEENTGLVVIGSRQHPDDLYGHLLADDNWTHIVERMHTADCLTDEDDLAGHVACMLWPEVRSYTYMRKMLLDPIVRTQFAMVYLNEPQDAETSTFPRDVVDGCRDMARIDGQLPEQPFLRLIAGLDPAGTGYQAAFLWAVNQSTGERHAIDFNNRLGGGIQRAREQVADWFEKYGCRHWVVESNLYQGAIEQDEILKKYCSENSITLEGHGTYGNKWDPQLGVSVLATYMQAGKLTIPWGDAETEAKWMQYRRQLINFSRENTRRAKSDIVMASWFPEERIQRWVREWQATVAASDDNFDDMFPFEPLIYHSGAA